MRVIKYHIKEKSLLARIAAFKLKTASVAMVIGRTIHLHGVSREDFLKNPHWVRHEFEHLRQFADFGKWGFMIRYTWESIKRGYYNNKFEAEARNAEKDISGMA